MSIKCVLLKKDIVYFSDHRKTDYWSKRQKTKQKQQQNKQRKTQQHQLQHHLMKLPKIL